MGCIFNSKLKNLKDGVDKISSNGAKKKIVIIGLDGAGKTSILN
jgi:GTPase SAR1 family protein